MNRTKAFAIVGESLDLAQDLSGHAMLRDPKTLKETLSREELIEELNISHQAFVKATRAAYDLNNKLTEWASTYPLIKESW